MQGYPIITLDKQILPDLSQKAEKGKSLLRRPTNRGLAAPGHDTFASILRSGRGSGKKRRQLARAWAPKAAAPHFPALHTAVGLPGGLVLVVRGSLAAPGVGRSPGLPQRALVCAAPRAWLPLRAWLLLAWPRACWRCVYVAKSRLSHRQKTPRKTPRVSETPLRQKAKSPAGDTNTT